MMHFFASVEWWKTEPYFELVNNGTFCLDEPGRLYVIYIIHGGDITAKLDHGRYEVKRFNLRNGDNLDASVAYRPDWTSPSAKDRSGWVILMKSL